jgi:hypothetical protein
VLDWTRAQVALMRPEAKVGQLRSIVADLMETPAGMTQIMNKISGVTQRVEIAGSHPLLGRLVPDITLADGQSIRSAFVKGNFVLLDRSVDSVFLDTAAPWQKRTALIADLPLRAPSTLLAMLARPDGVIVWIATSQEKADQDSLKIAFRKWCGRGTSRQQSR